MAFGFILKNIEDGGFTYFYAHENNTLQDRSKLVCTHDDLANLKGFSQQNRRHRVLQPRKNEHKVEVLQINKLDLICCFTQKRTYGVQERSLIRTSA